MRAVRGRRGTLPSPEPTRAPAYTHRERVVYTRTLVHPPAHPGPLPSSLAPASQVADDGQVAFPKASLVCGPTLPPLSCVESFAETDASNGGVLAVSPSDQAGGVYCACRGHHLGPGAQSLGRGLRLLHHLRGHQDPNQPLQPLPPAPGVWVRRGPQGASLGQGGHGCRDRVGKLWGWAGRCCPRILTPRVASPLPRPVRVSPCLAQALAGLQTSPSAPSRSLACLGPQGSQDEAQGRLSSTLGGPLRRQPCHPHTCADTWTDVTAHTHLLTRTHKRVVTHRHTDNSHAHV